MAKEAARGGVAIGLTAVALLVSMAGLVYAHFQNIPAGLAIPLAAAFALEAVLYVTTCWERARRTVERRLSGAPLAALAAATAVAPYLLCAPWCGVFRWTALGELSALAMALSFWFVVFPRGPVVNLLFIAGVAAPLLARRFDAIYGVPSPGLPLGVLGQLMWTRTAVIAALSTARLAVNGFGLVPSLREWRAGLVNFLLFAPVGIGLGWTVGLAAYHPRDEQWSRTLGVAAATFLGMFWVVALREEFFFRGLLQEWLEGWTRRTALAVALTAVVFGLVHLPFRGFPNWRFALVAAVAGAFYGRAYWQTSSVRAAMITHALVNTAWKVFFN